MGFIAKRVKKSGTMSIQAAPAAVFPLLCPKREEEWIDGWAAKVIYSQSGVAELDAVFVLNKAPEGESCWVTTRYEPPVAVDYTWVAAGLMTTRLSLRVAENGNDASDVAFSYCLTGLSETGNGCVAEYEKRFDAIVDGLEKKLNHFIKYGRMLKIEG